MGHIGKVVLLSSFIFTIFLQINSSALSNILFRTNKLIGNRDNREYYDFQHQIRRPPGNPSSGYFFLPQPQQGYGQGHPPSPPYQSNWSLVQFLDIIMNGIRIILDISTLNDDQDQDSNTDLDTNYDIDDYENGPPESNDPSNSEYYF